LTYIKRIHKHTTSILKCAVLVLSVTLTATLQAETDPKQSQVQTLSKTQIECLSRVAYHEAKGESDRGMIAVMQVTMNRVKSEKFANTICGVVYSPNQYSWSKYNPPIKEPKQYERAKRLAYEVVNGKHHDISGKALYFNSLHKQPKGTVCTVRIGGHSFYKPVK
jgi:spore germination cell wall hydrolase CwlJ-like protein